jgi:hypothetical protein
MDVCSGQLRILNQWRVKRILTEEGSLSIWEILDYIQYFWAVQELLLWCNCDTILWTFWKFSELYAVLDLIYV